MTAENGRKSLKKTSDYRVSTSFESDLAPIHTVRGIIKARSPKSATSRAAQWANKNRPFRRRFRSWVIVVEDLGAPSE